MSDDGGVKTARKYERQCSGGRPAGGTERKPGAGRPPHPVRRVDMRVQVRPDVKLAYDRLTALAARAGASRFRSDIAEIALEHYLKFLGMDAYLDEVRSPKSDAQIVAIIASELAAVKAAAKEKEKP